MESFDNPNGTVWAHQTVCKYAHPNGVFFCSIHPSTSVELERFLRRHRSEAALLAMCVSGGTTPPTCACASLWAKENSDMMKVIHHATITSSTSANEASHKGTVWIKFRGRLKPDRAGL